MIKSDTTKGSNSFENLIRAMAEGSEEAAWELTAAYSPHILRVVRSSLPQAIRTKVDSQDFLQSIWATLLLEPEGLTRFSEAGQFVRYVAAIAKHKVVDKYRHFSTQKNDVQREIRGGAVQESCSRLRPSMQNRREAFVDQQPTPSQLAAVRERWQRVLAESCQRDRDIIALRLKGLAYKNIAENLKVNERTVQRSITRIVSEFQQ